MGVYIRIEIIIVLDSKLSDITKSSYKEDDEPRPCHIHKYNWTSLDGKTHNQIDHIVIDWRWHSSIPDVQSFGEADCDTDQYLKGKVTD
jgi:hypothetical protein